MGFEPVPRKRVIHPHLRMTTLDEYMEGYEMKRRVVSVEALKAAYDLRTLENQVGVKVRHEEGE